MHTRKTASCSIQLWSVFRMVSWRCLSLGWEEAFRDKREDEKNRGALCLAGNSEYGGNFKVFFGRWCKCWQITNPHTSQDGDQHTLASGKLKNKDGWQFVKLKQTLFNYLEKTYVHMGWNHHRLQDRSIL